MGKKYAVYLLIFMIIVIEVDGRLKRKKEGY